LAPLCREAKRGAQPDIATGGVALDRRRVQLPALARPHERRVSKPAMPNLARFVSERHTARQYGPAWAVMRSQRPEPHHMLGDRVDLALTRCHLRSSLGGRQITPGLVRPPRIPPRGGGASGAHFAPRRGPATSCARTVDESTVPTLRRRRPPRPTGAGTGSIGAAAPERERSNSARSAGRTRTTRGDSRTAVSSPALISRSTVRTDVPQRSATSARDMKATSGTTNTPQ